MWVRGTPYDGTNPAVNGGPCAINCSNVHDAGIYSFHLGGAHVALADGAVKFLNESVATFQFASIITRRRNELFEMP